MRLSKFVPLVGCGAGWSPKVTGPNSALGVDAQRHKVRLASSIGFVANLSKDVANPMLDQLACVDPSLLANIVR